MSVTDWRAQLSDEERARVASAGFARRVGLGERPAVVVIDVQNYMVGPPPGALEVDAVYPSACGPVAEAAVKVLADFLPAMRRLGVPVFYSRFELEPDGSDGGVYLRKRDLMRTDGWCLAGSTGAQIVPAVAPEPGDIVYVKKKPSAFFGTPLLSYLVDRGVDSLLVTGGSTSNCVRATCVDAMSYNLRTTVIEDGVFDRFPRSHVAALFDLDRQYGDVRPAADVVAELEARRG
ncbi:MAG: isochorismatase family protein [Motilibacteraceae bacterium]